MYYKVLKLKYTNDSTTAHDIFVKKHATSEETDDKPAHKTLLIHNVPPYATENALKRAFSNAGDITKVILQNKPPKSDRTCSEHAFKDAYIIFTKTSSVKQALNLSKLRPLFKHGGEMGMKKWINEYRARLQDADAIQKQIDQFMAVYDRDEAMQTKAEKTRVDEDGWTLVTKHGRKPGLARKERVLDRIKQRHLTKNRAPDKFYTFQVRESKMKQIDGLRRKFDVDKKRVEELKAKRKFKPV